MRACARKWALYIAAGWLLILAPPSTCADLGELLLDDPRLNVVSAAILSLNGMISPVDDPPFTLFAPTDAAFIAAIAQGSLRCGDGELCADLVEWLNYMKGVEKLVFRHVFHGKLLPNNFQDGMVLKSVDGGHVKVEQEDDWALRVGGAEIQLGKSVIPADDGVLVVIDSLFVDYSRLNTSVIESAELAVDIGPFTAAQRAILVEEVSENINWYRQVRSLELPDGAVQDHSVLSFNPVLYGYESEVENQLPGRRRPAHKVETQSVNHAGSSDVSLAGIKWTISDKVVRPKDDEDLVFMTVLQLASLIRQEKVTSLELTKLYLERLKRYDLVLETVVTFTEDLALQQAAAADAEIKAGKLRGPLHGIPYGLKDLISVPDYPTTWGAAPYKNQTFKEGAWVYEKLKEAGAVLVAKLSTGAMAWGDVWFGGRTKNPWNIAEGSCGSSSGSGAATSAGLVPFAIGTETWGSMSCPSETMGVTGFRPTFGTVGRTGIMTLASSLDKVGPFCRTAMDCGAIMDAMRGRDPGDPSSVDAPFKSPEDIQLSDLRIGFSKDADIKVVTQLTELGATMVPVNVNLTVPAKALMNTILGAEAGAHFDNWLRTDKSKYMREQHKWPSFIRSARLIPAVEYVQANRARGRLMKQVYELMQGLDGLVMPARGKGEGGAMGNVLGLPQIVFPTGFAPLSGSMESPRKNPEAQAVIGLPFMDHKVIAIVNGYQMSTDAHLMRPPIDNVESTILDLCLPFSRCDLESAVSLEGGGPTIKLSWASVGGSD